MWMIFKIVANNEPEQWHDQISSSFSLKSIGPLSYYLGNDYNWSEDEKAWVLGCATYMKECIHQLEDDQLFGTLHPHKSPLPAGCHPELDESQLLDLNDNFRMNTGMVDMVPLIIWLL
jgi:hypothetical protein